MLSCGILETPRFGRKSNFMFTPGATVTFECNEGFYLQGDRRRICGLDGRWDIPEHGYTECLRESHTYFIIASFLCQHNPLILFKNEHLFPCLYDYLAKYFESMSISLTNDIDCGLNQFSKFKKCIQTHNFYRRGLLHSIHRMDCHSHLHFRHNANDSLLGMRCLSISKETIEEGSQLCFANSPFTLRFKNHFEGYEWHEW